MPDEERYHSLPPVERKCEQLYLGRVSGLVQEAERLYKGYQQDWIITDEIRVLVRCSFTRGRGKSVLDADAFNG